MMSEATFLNCFFFNLKIKLYLFLFKNKIKLIFTGQLFQDWSLSHIFTSLFK